MNKNVKYIFILVILAYFIFVFGNGLISLTNPDEVFYSQTAKEMARHHSWMTPILFDEPQFEKPILISWLLRISFLMFGIDSFSARFFPAFFALLGVIAVYLLGKLLFKVEKKSFIAASVLLSGGFYIALARTVFTDMVFSVLILFSLLSFFWGYREERNRGAGIILFFVFSALAVLAKGPLGLLIPVLVVITFLIVARKINFIFCRYTLLGLVIFSAIALPWYVFVTVKYNHVFIREFFYNDHYRRIVEAEHLGNDTWYFYPLTMIACMFPWSIFVAAALFHLFRHIRKTDNNNLFLACWITVTFLVFQFAHSKLSSYIFPMFPALALACGDFIYDSITGKRRQRQFFVLSVAMWFISLLVFSGVTVAALRFSYYLSSLLPLYLLISVFVLWLAVTAFYLAKNRYVMIFYFLVLLVPMLMAVIPFIHKDIEQYVSSKYACEYLLRNYPVNPETYLLCSKDFVRGTRFYTDMKVATFAPYAKNFFSPHPIPFLDTDEKAKDFLRKNQCLYGFLKKSSLEDLKRVAGKQFRYEILKKIGNQYIIEFKK